MMQNYRRHATWLALAILILSVRGASSAEIAAEGQKPQRKGDLYPLERCVVTGAKLGAMGEPVVLLHEGREIRFCCKNCVSTFKESPEKYLAKIDAAIIKAQKDIYPLDTCLVSGGKLGSMGEPIEHVYNNRLIRFCCKGCIEPFEKAPQRFLAKLDQAVIEKQKEAYPLDTCVVLGGKLGGMGTPVEYVQAGRLVRLCCQGCVAAFEKEPQKYWKTIDAAAKKKTAGDSN